MDQTPTKRQRLTGLKNQMRTGCFQTKHFRHEDRLKVRVDRHVDMNQREVVSSRP